MYLSMISRGLATLVAFMLGMSVVAPREAPSAPAIKPIETTVCKILENPAGFNNKLVKVRGFVDVNFEYSVLTSEACRESNGIWFVLADGSAIPGLVVTIHGKAVAGAKDSKGRWTPPIRVALKRDANFEKFESYLAAPEAQAGKPCGPDCHEYRATATFIGRIDAVSKEIHAAHLKQPRTGRPDFKGFGQMGLFDAEMVVQSVAGVEVEDLAHPGAKISQPK
jgi:hypothetical protein